jgi:hypothetical protein
MSSAHILLHGKREQFIEDEPSTQDPKEQEANRFASEVLTPSQHQAGLPRLESLDAIEDFAARISLAPGLVVGRSSMTESSDTKSDTSFSYGIGS